MRDARYRYLDIEKPTTSVVCEKPRRDERSCYCAWKRVLLLGPSNELWMLKKKVVLRKTEL